MHKHITRVALIVAILFCSMRPARCYAWIDTGHKIIGLIVWDELSPQQQAAFSDILKQHPRYKEDLLRDLPENSSDDETAEYAFATAATWPDMVRAQNNPMHFVASHPNWHYIDIPYCIGGQTPQPDTRPVSPGPTNAVEALIKNTADLKDPKTSPADRAIALCWVLHLGGDIHQPLHAVSMFSPQFPKGDQGGNALTVLRDPPYADSQTNLHLLWDSLPGSFRWEHVDVILANGLRVDPRYGRDRFKDELAKKDFSEWAQESHDLAVKYGYLNGDLKFVPTQQVRRDSRMQIPGVPPDYVINAERIAMERVVLAGYRTADLLKSILDAK